jgi:hypothetical protein
VTPARIKSDFENNAQAMLKDRRMRLEASRLAWDDTANPVFVWEAIKTCTDQNWRLPDWVSVYLAAVAERMTAEPARKAPDLRKILPTVLGFPKKNRGSGRLLEPLFGVRG